MWYVWLIVSWCIHTVLRTKYALQTWRFLMGLCAGDDNLICEVAQDQVSCTSLAKITIFTRRTTYSNRNFHITDPNQWQI